MTPEEQVELAELQNPETWDWEHAEMHPPVRDARTVVKVAFPRPEFDRIERAARRANLSVGEFIRQAALAHSTGPSALSTVPSQPVER